MSTLDPLFSPKSVAVLGASFASGGRPYLYVRALVESGYGGEVIPVHPTDLEVCGRRVCPQLKEAKREIDVVVAAVPAADAVAAVREAAAAKAHALILPEGCGGPGAAGVKARKEALSIARAAKMRLLGPRAGGVADPQMGVGLSATFDLPRERGGISLVAPDMAYVLMLAAELRPRNRGFARAVAYGEQLDVDVADLLEYLGKDSRTEAILLVLDGLRDGQRFLAIASEVSLQKPVAALHVGEAGTPDLYATAFRQGGLYAAQDLEELIDIGVALSTSQRNLPANESVAVVAYPGGLAAAATGACARAGLSPANWEGKTAKALKGMVGEEAGSPLAIAPSFPSGKLGGVFDAVTADGKVGGVLLLTGGFDLPDLCEGAIESRRKSGKPIVAMVAGAPNAAGALFDGGIPCYATPERAARAYAGLLRYRRLLEVQKRKGILARPKAPPAEPPADAPAKERELKAPEVFEILRGGGVAVPEGAVLESLKTAGPALRKIGFPVTLRALPARKVGKDGVALLTLEGLKNRKELDRGFVSLRKKFHLCPVFAVSAGPKGSVVPIHVRRDAVFGPVITLEGPAGRVSRVCPLGRTEAELLLADAGFPTEGRTHTAITDLVVRVCQVTCDREGIQELTLAPRIADNGSLWVGDAGGVTLEPRA